MELADRLLHEKYTYIVTTHIDKNHMHNHIIFCAADNIDHLKYDDNKRSYSASIRMIAFGDFTASAILMFAHGTIHCGLVFTVILYQPWSCVFISTL